MSFARWFASLINKASPVDDCYEGGEGAQPVVVVDHANAQPAAVLAQPVQAEAVPMGAPVLAQAVPVQPTQPVSAVALPLSAEPAAAASAVSNPLSEQLTVTTPVDAPQWQAPPAAAYEAPVFTDLKLPTKEKCCEACSREADCVDFVFEAAHQACVLLPHVPIEQIEIDHGKMLTQ